MKLLKCENGHYFDNDAYENCPLCGAAPAAKYKTNESDKRRLVFGKAPRSEERSDHPMSKREKAAEDDQTVALPRESFADNAEREVVTPEPAVRDTAEPAPAPTVEPEPVQQPAPVPQPVPAPSPQPAPTASDPAAASLAASLQQASAMSEGKTLSYFSAAKKAKLEEAPSPASPAASVPAPAPVPAAQPVSTPDDPVVGWLVCIGGPHLCETLPLFAGLNSIGRSSNNRVVLGKDQAVSREKHAFITFEPRFRQFFVRAGDSSGLTYLNGKYIFETRELVAKDIIEVGQSRFWFLPLCGEDFNWDQYLE